MGLRDRLRKGVRKRLRKGKRERSTDSRKERSATRQRLAQAKARLEAVDAGDAPTSEDDTRDQFARAQDTATAAPPIRGATLDPFGRPERMEQLARGETGGERTEDRPGTRRDDEPTMEDLVLGTGGQRPDQPEDTGPRVDDLARLDGDDGEGLLHFGGDEK